MTVVVFANRAEYEAFYAPNGRVENTLGRFIPAADLVMVLDQSDDTYGTLYHEAFHQFMHRHVPNAPRWLDEGLATMFGSGMPAGASIRYDIDRPRWTLVKTLLSDSKHIPLDQLLKATPQQFYDNKPVDVQGFPDATMASICYAESYTFAHYLSNSRQRLPLLQNYIRDLAKAKPNEQAAVLAKHFPPDVLATLEVEWRKWIDQQ